MKKIKLNKRPHRAAIGKFPAMLLIGAAIQIPCLPPLQAAPATKELPDSGITSAVEGALMWGKGVFPNDVDVSTSQGIVTLSGSGSNLLVKERAVKIAESIRGVRGVIDRIAVTPASRPDADIRKDIMTALLLDPATESYQVAVSVESAAATLTGKVGSYAEKQLAARIAKGIKGIKEVRNDLTVNYQAKRTDAEIDADVKSRLRWDIWINGDMIDTVVKDGNVTLSGIVGSTTTKSRAYDDAWMNGVVSVDDSGLKIEPWASNDARRKLKYAVRSDSEIKLAVQAALRLDPRVSAFSPDVTVEDGIVRLAGTVGNLKAKASAEQDAKNIVSVWQVDNNLKVRPKTPPTDAEMTSKLTGALGWDAWLDNATVNASVKNRVALLSGTVESSFQKAEAQDVASRTTGVLSVRNQLKVEPEYAIYDYPYYPGYDYGYFGGYGSYGWPYYNQWPNYSYETFALPPYLSDEQIKKNVEKSFFWSPFVDSDDIKVTVEGGVATLTGTVGTWIGWGEADKDARKSGAASVVNRVTVKKSSWLW